MSVFLVEQSEHNKATFSSIGHSFIFITTDRSLAYQSKNLE